MPLWMRNSVLVECAEKKQRRPARAGPSPPLAALADSPAMPGAFR